MGSLGVMASKRSSWRCATGNRPARMSAAALSRTTERIRSWKSSVWRVLVAAAAAAPCVDLRHRVQDMLGLDVALERERVAMGDVRQLVADDHCQLRLVVEAAEEPRVHVDVAVRQREGVQRRVAQDAELEAGPARAAYLLGGQP